MSNTCRITIDDCTTTAVSGTTLFDVADQLGVRIPASCSRVGRCHECLVDVIEGRKGLNRRTEAEAFLQGHFRLACEARIENTDYEVVVRTLRREKAQIVTHGRDVNVHFAPNVRRAGKRVLIRGLDVGEYTGHIYGLAVDVGTSTVVMQLHDLEHDAPAGLVAFENPQIFGGSNVLQRIHYEVNIRKNELRHVLVNFFNRALGEFGVNPHEIYEAVFAGNPTMRDILCSISLQTLGELPFKSLTQLEQEEGKRTTTAITAPAAEMGLEINPAGQIYALPVIGCHVGADTAACLAAIGIEREERLVMLCDMGTNSEMVIGNRHKILAASSPAGPAFEGAGISCGMPALGGAIESVSLNGGVPHCRTIGDLPARGICGSGLIDVLAQLMLAGKMTVMGRLRDAPNPFPLDADRGVQLTESDISLLAQAKATSHAAHVLLAARYGASFDELDVYYLAGGFATYINLDHAQYIGLIPPVAQTKIDKLGNAALAGALALLRAAPERAKLETLVKRIEHVELETDPRFFDTYVDGCAFGPMAALAP